MDRQLALNPTCSEFRGRCFLHPCQEERRKAAEAEAAEKQRRLQVDWRLAVNPTCESFEAVGFCVRKRFARPRKQKQRNRKGGFRWTGSLSFEAVGFCAQPCQEELRKAAEEEAVEQERRLQVDRQLEFRGHWFLQPCQEERRKAAEAEAAEKQRRLQVDWRPAVNPTCESFEAVGFCAQPCQEELRKAAEAEAVEQERRLQVDRQLEFRGHWFLQPCQEERRKAAEAEAAEKQRRLQVDWRLAKNRTCESFEAVGFCAQPCQEELRQAAEAEAAEQERRLQVDRQLEFRGHWFLQPCQEERRKAAEAEAAEKQRRLQVDWRPAVNPTCESFWFLRAALSGRASPGRGSRSSGTGKAASGGPAA